MITSKVQVLGNIGKIEAQYTPQGKYVLKGSVAVNIGRGEKKVTNWYNFTAWQDLGEWMNRDCEVGTRVILEGKLVVREWKDKEGNGHYSLDVTVSDYTVVGKGKKREESDEDEPEFMKD